MRHDPGLAASPPVRYMLKMEGCEFVDTGHFALETHVEEIATAIKEFLTLPAGPGATFEIIATSADSDSFRTTELVSFAILTRGVQI